MLTARKWLPILLVAGMTAAPLAAQAQQTQAPFTFKSVNLDLPPGERTFPGGSSADAINANCLICHSAGMVLNQPAMPKAMWAAEVSKMINVFKAPVQSDDVAAIVAYLASTKGTK